MYNYTNYTLFSITELKYRLFHIFINSFIIMAYCIYNINFFLLYFLKPLEYMNIDLDFGSYTSILFFLLNHINLTDSNLIHHAYSEYFSLDSQYSKYDYYPSFEINSESGQVLYLFLIEYYMLLYGVPIFIYQLYLFLSPGIFFFENSNIKKKLFFMFFIIHVFYKYFNWWLILLYSTTSFNTYHEFYQYEFDIEFDIISFLKLNLLLLLISYINIIYLLINIRYVDSIGMKSIYIIYNIYIYNFFFLFLFNIIIYYIITWLWIFIFFL